MTDSISMSSISSLDITRNPFESTQDRLNFPGYSPSMFVKQETPASERKKKSFKWDIDQISILYPAEIEEHPHQDYSSTSPCLRVEDKMRVEREAEEYFSQSSILPSPWTPDRSLKRVTFSPLPPTTAYISACNSSGDSSYLSPNNSAMLSRAEVGSQTSLSFPIDLDLQNILGSDMYTSYSDQEENKEMSVSSLRRKLFAQCDLSSPVKAKNSKDPLQTEEHILKSILKSPKSPNWITSSPLSVKKKSPVFSPSFSDGMTSPDVSPIKQPTRIRVDANNNKTPVRRSSSSMEVSFNVMESSDIQGSCSPLFDLSPIKEADNKEKPKEAKPSDASSMASENNKEDCDEVEQDVKDEEEELPAVLTMHDLVEPDEDGDTEEIPGLRVEELASSKQDKEVRRETDQLSENMDIDSSEEKVIENIIVSPSKTTSNTHENQTELTSNDLSTKESKSKLENKRTELPEEWRTHKSTFLQLDDELVMMKAMAALRRADRILPPYKTKSYASLYSTSNLNITSSLKTTNLSIMNTSTLPWQPVGMSTPLPRQSGRVRVYGSSYDCDYCNSSIDKSELLTMPFRQVANRSPVFFSGNLESGLGRSNYASNDSLYSFGQSTKKLSPVMEDILRRKEVLKNSLEEVRIRPEASSYSSRSFIPRTHPLSNADRRRLYGKTIFGSDLDNHLRREYKRSSWPSAGVQSVKLVQGSRPLDPPVFLPPTKYSRSEVLSDPPISSPSVGYPQSKIYGRAYKLPIPAPFDDTDSGFADWKRSISRWESTTKMNNDVFSGHKQKLI